LGGAAIAVGALGGSLADDEAGVLILAALSSIATAAQFLGAPYARAGKPSPLRIAFLYLAGSVGVVLTVAVSPWVALGVVSISYSIVFLAMARWPPSEGLEQPVTERIGRISPGAMVASGALILPYFAVPAAVAGLTNVDAVLIVALALTTLAIFGCALWIAWAYAGRPTSGFTTKQRLRTLIAAVQGLDAVADDARSLRAEIDHLRADQPVTRDQLDRLTSRAGELMTRLEVVAAEAQGVRTEPSKEAPDDERPRREDGPLDESGVGGS
jgi:hypothetical protein